MLDKGQIILENGFRMYKVPFLILFFIFFLLLWGNIFRVNAQDTFGPICDDVTVTCAPTATPTQAPTTVPGTPTATPTPTNTPTLTPTIVPGQGGQPPATPTELPRAGMVENVTYLIIISVLLVVTGIFGRFLPLKKG